MQDKQPKKPKSNSTPIEKSVLTEPTTPPIVTKHSSYFPSKKDRKKNLS